MSDKAKDSGKSRKRERGSIRPKGKNSFEVRVYAGLDPLTKKALYLTGSAGDMKEAEKLRTKFLAQVDEKRHPKSNVLFVTVLERYLTVMEGEESTLDWYASLIRNYIAPTFATTKAGALSAEMLDLFYARLRRCREQCEGKRAGRVSADTGKPHTCMPLKPATVRKIHFFIRPALDAAIRWGYLSVNIADLAAPPGVPRKEPDPPSVEEAARVLNAAWKRDHDWATMLWLAMITGCRRGELCSVQWCDVDFSRRILWVAFSEQRLKGGRRRRKDTKTHQKRRIALDLETVELLQDLLTRRKEAREALGIAFDPSSYLFSPKVDGTQPYAPSSITRRYKRLAINLSLSSHRLHSLRHYSASELVSAGVDLRTVAGRLGHGSGGATTLKVYAAFSPIADQRAATIIGKQLPRPGRRNADEAVTVINGRTLACQCGNRTTWNVVKVEIDLVSAICAGCQSQVLGEEPTVVHEIDLASDDEADLSPYQLVAQAYRAAITDGTLAPGDPLPTVKTIASIHDVSVGTAHRAVALLAGEGLVTASRGVRARVRSLDKIA